MSAPNDRHSFKEVCLRRLGWPDIDINLSDATIEDRIDEALNQYLTFNYEANEQIYYKYAIQQADKDNKYIQMPDNIVGAISIFDLGSAFGSGDIFNVTYQLALSEVWNLTNFNIVPYYMAMEHVQLLQELLVGKQPIRYNRNVNKLYLDTNWDRFAVGDYIVIECYQVISPDQYPKIWSDVWLSRYATALIQKNWGQVLSKYTGIPMPGGMMLNGDKILAQADADIAKLEDEMVRTFSMPSGFLVGLWISALIALPVLFSLLEKTVT